jgi:hypothetical protein
VAKAESSGAEENAPYEYWGSVTYLEQSKILMGYSEYERSFDYGERAKQLAEEATKKAEMRRKGRWSRERRSRHARSARPRCGGWRARDWQRRRW